ncbi:hypothetical protein IP88_10955 [alpha proteobacterium AAP81b]|nr:hypothetical protein IP88_10955 [alpha proteobacterium AAP81b]
MTAAATAAAEAPAPGDKVAAGDADPAASEEMIVTGSRIARTGYDAPTPVSIVSEVQLKAEPQANISDFVNTLPSVRGSQTSSTNSGSLSNGQAGINSVNLRALGAQRTLVLIDGQRSVASTTVGIVDTQTVPQGLIKGVEVVTGGASSAYGSDAVTGIVNFQLNRDFDGLRLEYEYGVTTYGDAPNHTARLTFGHGFAGGRGRVLVAGDYFQQKGIDTIDRDWNNAGFFQIDNPAYVAGNGLPERLVGAGIGTYQFTPGGIINCATPVGSTRCTNSAFNGTYFGVIGSNGQPAINQFVYGPRRGQWMQGGDYEISRDGHLSSNSLAPNEERGNAFVRVSYEWADWLKTFAQFSYSAYSGQSFYQQSPIASTSGGLANTTTIQADNAFLPTALRNQLAAAGIRSIDVGSSIIGIPPQGSDNFREVFRYVLGGDGDFDLFGKAWKWNAYYQVGLAKTDERLTNTWRNSLLSLAQDAVFAPAGNSAGIAAGTIVCRSTLTAPTNGCVPLNRIGIGGVTPAALTYIFNNGAQPQRLQSLRQDVFQANVTTNDLFNTWQGPVSLAFGLEYRRERVDGFVDPQFNSGWLYGNYLVTRGAYDVIEGYLETVIPVWKGLDINGAVRFTNYSTSGLVTTWKVGATWQVIDDIKLRVTRSQDIRAPNLSELFAPGTARTNTVNVAQPGGGQRTDQFTEQTTGNLALTPEKALTWGVGTVLTPGFLPGFAASVDYFEIDLQDAISTISAQTITTLCVEQNRQDICQFITFNGTPGAASPITGIRLVPFNFARLRVRGIDMEASYRRDIGPGTLTLRGLISHYIENTVDNGIDVPRDLAGQNAGGGDATPAWNYRLTANYDLEHWGFNIVGRGFSDGVYDNNFVECTSGCPASTAAARTINNNRISGQWYLDASMTHRFKVGGVKAEAFLYVRNLLNSDPVYVGNGPTGNNTPAYPQTNRNLYDVLGRTFRIGVRVQY